MTKNLIFLSAIVLLMGMIACNSGTKTTNEKAKLTSSVKDSTLVLCGECGEIKGSDKCCVANAEKCDKCGLDKDSPGCCKIKGDTELCTKCGQIKGSDKCCVANAVKCDKCGLDKGSPGCCKIK